MSKHLSIESQYLALISSRREGRVTVRAWRQRGSERSGAWMVLGPRPLRLSAGRDVPAESLL